MNTNITLEMVFELVQQLSEADRLRLAVLLRGTFNHADRSAAGRPHADQGAGSGTVHPAARYDRCQSIELDAIRARTTSNDLGPEWQASLDNMIDRSSFADE